MVSLKKFPFVIAIIFLTSCSNIPLETLSGPRTIIINGKSYSEPDLGGFVSWRCKDFVSSSGILVEVGFFTNPKLDGVGFILFDGGNSGEVANYQREGLLHRWNWGPNGVDFSFFIKPDGTGLYYDFSSVPSGEQTEASDVYKCSQ